LDPYESDVPKSISPKINNVVFSKPDWISNNPKYDKYKSLYEKLTIFDRATRVEQLTNTKTLDENNQEFPLLELGDRVTILGIVKELRNAQKQLVDLPSEIGSYIWNMATEKSITKEHTSWDNFYEQFQSKFSVVLSRDNNDKVFNCFKLILNTYGYSEINRISWELFSTWFSFALASDDKVNELLEFIKDIYETGWYFGFMDKERVENILMEKISELTMNGKQKKNTYYYVVRSTSTPGTFAVNYCKIEMPSTPVQEDIVLGETYKEFDKVIPSIDKYLRELQTKDKSNKFDMYPSIAEAIFSTKEHGGGGYQVTLKF